MKTLSISGIMAVIILVLSLVADGLFVAVLLGAFNKKHKLLPPSRELDGDNREFCSNPEKYGGQKCA
jgi:hypothetical protein